MRNFILVLLLMFSVIPLAGATDWSRYDSGLTSLRVEGYHTQPGYIGFYDETGVVRGYLYAHSNGNLYWTHATDTLLTSEKLGTNGGEAIVNNTPPTRVP